MRPRISMWGPVRSYVGPFVRPSGFFSRIHEKASFCPGRCSKVHPRRHQHVMRSLGVEGSGAEGWWRDGAVGAMVMRGDEGGNASDVRQLLLSTKLVFESSHFAISEWVRLRFSFHRIAGTRAILQKILFTHEQTSSSSSQFHGDFEIGQVGQTARQDLPRKSSKIARTIFKTKMRRVGRGPGGGSQI